MTDTREVHGRCLCGTVRMTVKPKNNSVGACHCSMCRRWGGGPLFAVECSADIDIEGDEAVSVYRSSDWAERGFCNRCGTNLFYRFRPDGHYAIPVGLLDDGGNWVFDEQIFIDEKPAYYSFANETKNLTGPEVFAMFSPADD